jgi:hypothetical protein
MKTRPRWNGLLIGSLGMLAFSGTLPATPRLDPQYEDARDVFGYGRSGGGVLHEAAKGRDILPDRSSAAAHAEHLRSWRKLYRPL